MQTLPLFIFRFFRKNLAKFIDRVSFQRFFADGRSTDNRHFRMGGRVDLRHLYGINDLR